MNFFNFLYFFIFLFFISSIYIFLMNFCFSVFLFSSIFILSLTLMLFFVPSLSQSVGISIYDSLSFSFSFNLYHCQSLYDITWCNSIFIISTNYFFSKLLSMNRLFSCIISITSFCFLYLLAVLSYMSHNQYIIFCFFISLFLS